ncbi:hypothetical protein VTJ04DRAFT_199 [Mycothermus thermophilus]|uniref:uncharacterized protein n=1 Tax=Humicola insolens TaxID=85995 RepID=UPI003742AB22
MGGLSMPTSQFPDWGDSNEKHKARNIWLLSPGHPSSTKPVLQPQEYLCKLQLTQSHKPKHKAIALPSLPQSSHSPYLY